MYSSQYFEIMWNPKVSEDHAIFHRANRAAMWDLSRVRFEEPGMGIGRRIL